MGKNKYSRIVIFIATLIPSAIYAQEPFVSEFIDCGTYTVSFDARNITLQKSMTSTSPYAPLRSGNRDATNNLLWIDRIFNMPDYFTEFHREYGRLVKEVLDGKINYLADPTMAEALNDGESYGVTIKTFTDIINFKFPKDMANLVGDYAEEAVNGVVDSLWNEANVFFNYLTLCLTYDYPEAFWLKSSFQWGYSYGYRYGYRSPADGNGNADYTINIYFYLKDPRFDYRRDEFTTGNSVQQACTEYNNLVSNIMANCPDGNRYAKISYFNDWLTKHNCYNSQFLRSGTAPTIAWSPLSAFRGSTDSQGPVCEGYARAFKVLCDKSNIPCVLAVGNAKSYQYDQGEAHMWNEVKMEDGNWYAVDVTWNDPNVYGKNSAVSGQENEKWLLLGSNTIVSSPSFTFAQSHPMSITWDINPDYVAQWDYDIHSFITGTHYNPDTSVPAASSGNGKLNVFDLTGRHIGAYPSPTNINSVLEPGIYIINGRKVSIQ